MIEDIVDYLRNPDWRRQHNWRRAIWMNLHRFGLTGLHSLPLNRRWVDIHRQPMPLAHLDPAHEGLKIVQISDLHYSPVVWTRYLTQYIQFTNELEPDLVVITGDLITGGYRYVRRIAGLLSRLKAPLGVVCTFGNHDYGMRGKHRNGDAARRGDLLASNLRDRGLIVLRNQALFVRRPEARVPLAIVGLDDLWTGRLNAAKAFAGVDPKLPIICLNHNPVNVRQLLEFPWQWMLSGHTHGRQVANSRLGQRFYPHRYRHYVSGHYSVEGRNLYVNRGVSYGLRRRQTCRPEITVFRLAGNGAA
jgi:uncharacterized protein